MFGLPLLAETLILVAIAYLLGVGLALAALGPQAPAGLPVRRRR